MRFIAHLLTFIFFVLLFCHEAEALNSKLQGVESFCFGIGSDVLTHSIEKLALCDLVVVDGEEASREQISFLQQSGAIVLAYLSVGTIEIGRGWYSKVSKYKLDLWGDWGEYYADVSKNGYRRIIDSYVAPRILRKGFDGLFLDNVDMIITHRNQTHGMKLLVKALSKRVHRNEKLLFTQNGDRVISKFTRHLDGWNREDFTSTYSFDSKSYIAVDEEEHSQIAEVIQRLSAKGLLITTTDYVSSEDTTLEALSVQEACRFGAIPFVSDIELTRMPQSPYLCSAG